MCVNTQCMCSISQMKSLQKHVSVRWLLRAEKAPMLGLENYRGSALLLLMDFAITFDSLERTFVFFLLQHLPAWVRLLDNWMLGKTVLAVLCFWLPPKSPPAVNQLGKPLESLNYFFFGGNHQMCIMETGEILYWVGHLPSMWPPLAYQMNFQRSSGSDFF